MSNDDDNEAQLKPGDRVEMTQEGIEMGLGRTATTATVIRACRQPDRVVVLRDGHKSEEYYHRDFWRRV